MKAWISETVSLVMAVVVGSLAVLAGFAVVFVAAILLGPFWPWPGVALAFVLVLGLLRDRAPAPDDIDGICDGAMGLVFDLALIGGLCGVAGGFLRIVVQAVL